MLKGKRLSQIEHPFEQLICSDFHTFSLPVALEMLQDPAFMPSLTSFKWADQIRGYLYDEQVHNLTRSINYILRSRKDIGVGRFKIEIEGYREPDESDRKKVYELMSGAGLFFEIAKNGDWIASI